MTSSPAYVLRVLGPVDLRHADGRAALSVLAQPKRVGLLAYLALEGRSGWVQRDALLPLFWPDSSEQHARTALRGGLHFLRQSLGSDAVEGTGAAVRLSPAAVDCDAARLLDAREAGDAAAVLELYRGAFLEGFHLSGVPAFERWQEATGRRLLGFALEAARALAAEEERSRGASEAVPYLRRAVELSPTDEDAFRRLLRGLSDAGDRAGALAAFDAWAAELRATLEVEPSAETLLEVERIREAGDAFGEARGAATAHAPVPAVRTEARTPVPERAGAGGTFAAVLSQPPLGGAVSPVSPDAGWTRSGSRVAGRWSGPLARRAAGWSAVGAALLGGTALLRLGDHSAPAPASAASAELLAVLPFEAVGDVPPHFAAAVPYLMDPALQRLPAVRVVDPSAVRDHAASSPGQPPSELARRLGAGRVLTGAVRAEGDGVVLEGVLSGEGGSRTARVTGRPEELPRLAGRLAAELVPELRGAGALPRLTGEIASLEPFVEGEDHFRSGRYAAAESAYERAVAADSTFALAHYRLSLTAEWRGNMPGARNAADRALTHSHRLSPHARQALDAWRAYLWGDIRAAVEGYDRLARDRPADLETWVRIGELRFHWGAVFGIPPAAADSAFAEVLRLSPDHAGALLHRFRFAGRTGDGAASTEIARRLRALGPAALEALQVDLQESLLAGEAPSGDAIRRLAETGGPQERDILAELATAMEDPRPVIAVIEALPDSSPRPRLLDRVWLHARILAGVGRYRDAERVLSALDPVAPDRTLELKAALLLARPGVPAPDTAARLAARVRTSTGIRSGYATIGFEGLQMREHGRLLLAALLERAAGNPRLDTLMVSIELGSGRFARPYRHLLGGWDAWRQGDLSGALGEVGALSPEPDGLRPGPLSYPLAMSRWIRAEALLALGRDDEALPWLEGFPEPGASDLMFLAPARLRRAEILERAGRLEEAADAYRLALRLWDRADPEVAPLVEAARTGLARVSR